ncbi:Uncharacterised protein [Mycobacteroides abscessus subsp. abscessus]|nr:Uncharacterised protein [Mycobacteroides abscessus subsp. abscessus]
MPRRIAVAGEGENAHDVQPGRTRCCRNRTGLVWGDSSAVMPGIDLDDNGDGQIAKMLGQLLSTGCGVHRHTQRCPGRHLPEPTCFLRGDPQRVGDEEVDESGLGEDLGLAYRGDGQADRATVNLAPGDFDALVALGMWP